MIKGGCQTTVVMNRIVGEDAIWLFQANQPDDKF